jgi:hypothetical protein
MSQKISGFKLTIRRFERQAAELIHELYRHPTASLKFRLFASSRTLSLPQELHRNRYRLISAAQKRAP